MPKQWFFYVLRCSDDSLYTGICTDVTRRLGEHNEGGVKSAKYTRARRPVILEYQEECIDRSSASKRECAIKKLTRIKKLALISA